MLRLRQAFPALALAAALAAPAAAQVKLEAKHKEGSAYTTEITSKVAQTMSIMGQDIETASEQIITSSAKVGQRRPDGNLPIDESIDAIRADVSLPGGITIAFDSAKPDEAPAEPPFNTLVDAMKALVGASWTVVLDKDGKVAGVEGAEKVLDKAQQISPEVAETMKGRFSAESLKRSTTEQYQRLPDVSVKPGDTWNRTEVTDLGAGQTLTLEKTYTYVGPEEKDGKKLEKITAKVNSLKYAQDPNAGGPAKVTAADLKIGENSETLHFDPEAGRFVETASTQKIAGSITLDVMGNELEATLDLTLEQNSKASDAK
jgi:hypothetical protein